MWRVFWVRLGAPYLCVWSGHLAAGRFLCTAPGPVAALAYSVCAWVLCTAGGPVAWPVLGTVGVCCGGVLRAVGPEGLLWSACSVGVRLVGWSIFCAQVGAYFQARLGSLVCVVIFGRVFGGCLGVVAWRVLCAALGLSCLL